MSGVNMPKWLAVLVLIVGGVGALVRSPWTWIAASIGASIALYLWR